MNHPHPLSALDTTESRFANDPALADAYVRAVGAASLLRDELQLPSHVPVQVNIGTDVCTGQPAGVEVQVNIGTDLGAWSRPLPAAAAGERSP